MIEPRRLTIYRAAELMRRGDLSAEALVHSCLERIAAREPQVHAWVALHGDEALAQAQRADRDAARHRWQGPLHGIPVGVKDIIDVQGMETRNGCTAYRPRRATSDAAAVARLREAGAIVLGKTETTALAYADPAPTRNPWNTAHTPGGSSSGSGAGVGDRMCLAALGTQTGGSVLRPASYNGVVGFKAGPGRISTAGVTPLSWSLDHVGCLTRDVADAHLLWRLLRRDATLEWQTSPDRLPALLVPRAPRRIWRLRGYFHDTAAPEVREALDAACARFAECGATLVEAELPPGLAENARVQQTIVSVEAATAHGARFADQPEGFPPRYSRMLREAAAISGVDYMRAVRAREAMQEAVFPLLAGVDVALLPTTKGPPPEPDTTGHVGFQRPWTLIGAPALTIPLALSPEGLPLGLQLVTAPGREEELLAHGAWCESVLGFHREPA